MKTRVRMFKSRKSMIMKVMITKVMIIKKEHDHGSGKTTLI
jgi:hypothetical protein